jgi:hypothetical protein
MNPFTEPPSAPTHKSIPIPTQAEAKAAMEGKRPIPPSPLADNPPVDNQAVEPGEFKTSLKLEDLVAKMKEGNFASFVVIAVNDTGAVLTARSVGATPQTYPIIGAMQIMQSQMIASECPADGNRS